MSQLKLTCDGGTNRLRIKSEKINMCKFSKDIWFESYDSFNFNVSQLLLLDPDKTLGVKEQIDMYMCVYIYTCTCSSQLFSVALHEASK